MNKIFLSILAFAISACGVRGDPVPPERSAELGRGQPTYREATRELAPPLVPPSNMEIEKEKNEKKKGN